MDINFEEYKIFYYTAIYGSISKAAEHLFISQPAITKTIKKLESQLDITLFTRTPKGVKLTENGKIFFEYISSGIESFQNGEHKLSMLKNLDEGVIKIGASTTVTKYFLLPYIEKFHKRYPNIEISITNHLTKDLVSMLKKGSLDILVLNLPMKNDDSLNVINCFTLHDAFAANSEYIGKINGKISLKDLAQTYPIVTQKSPSNTREFLNSIMEKNDIKFHPKFEVVSYSLVKDFAKIGMGISYITKEFAREEIESKKLYIIDLKEQIEERNLRNCNTKKYGSNICY